MYGIGQLSLRSRIMHWLRRSAVDENVEEPSDMYARADTRIIVGLGNPGVKYAHTRHNAGFMVIDEIASRSAARAIKKRFHAELTEVRYLGYRLVLAKPQTFMNDSGITVRELLNWYKVTPKELMIVVDDLDIPFGRLRLRPDGSAGGHNGLKSIFRETGTTAFPRLRVGIGRPKHEGAQSIGHVLSTFSTEEAPNLPKVIAASADTLEMWLKEGLLASMNAINGVPSVIEEPSVMEQPNNGNH